MKSFKVTFKSGLMSDKIIQAESINTAKKEGYALWLKKQSEYKIDGYFTRVDDVVESVEEIV